MAITFTPLHPVIGAACAGLDIGQPLTTAQAAAIDAGMDQYAVLVFHRNKPLTADEQRVFTHRWQVGGLVMWDNRTTMHRACRHEDMVYPRDPRRTTVTDGVPTVEHQAAA